MAKRQGIFSFFASLYRDGFRNMTWVSLLIPFVVTYIAFAWHAMDRKKITADEIEGTEHKY